MEMVFLVGMIDTGIDYEHPAFRYEDGSSKIYSLWDQTIEGNPEDTFLGYGTEYTKEQIEEALKSDVPQQKVPSKDESGHGTFLAGLIAGNEDNETGFSGIAPNAGLIVVKLRKAKDYLKEYYCIDPKVRSICRNRHHAGSSLYRSYCRTVAKTDRHILRHWHQPGISSWNRTIRPVSVRQSDASGSRSCYKRWK